MNIKKLHYFTGITLSIFVGFHLFNHLYSLFGPNAHIELMQKLRFVYRNVITEAILLLAVAVQIVSGLKLFSRKRKTASSFFEKLHISSGLYMAFFLVVHVGAVLSGRFILNLDTNFYFGAAGLNIFPLNLFFVPYYGLAIISFFGHIAAVHFKKMKYSPLGIRPHRQSFFILIFGILLSMIILYGLTNGFKGVEIPKEYNLFTSIM
ncbi:hypothetical protein [Lacinutrix sp. Hel_I_90]|uniref:hypothetical protein n=1 Tax=Lacinutrix sp. Hel_I_90 TaxID=1249999 RepID=UPI0005C8305F|nr:hypothetical protein [Lacinutrix sp. Hel_I_90]